LSLRPPGSIRTARGLRVAGVHAHPVYRHRLSATATPMGGHFIGIYSASHGKIIATECTGFNTSPGWPTPSCAPRTTRGIRWGLVSNDGSRIRSRDLARAMWRRGNIMLPNRHMRGILTGRRTACPLGPARGLMILWLQTLRSDFGASHLASCPAGTRVAYASLRMSALRARHCIRLSLNNENRRSEMIVLAMGLAVPRRAR
jgi:hypothetical protein